MAARLSPPLLLFAAALAILSACERAADASEAAASASPPVQSRPDDPAAPAPGTQAAEAIGVDSGDQTRRR